MSERDTIIYIPQGLIRDQGCSHLDVTVWCYTLMETYGPYKEKTMISASQIAYQIKEEHIYTQSMVTEIADSIRNLLEAGYLKGERVDRGHYVILRDSFNVSDYQYFIQVRVDDIRQIMRESSRPNSTLHYYLIFLSTINASTKCAYWSNESLADILSNDTTIITRYLYALEKMELLYVYRGIGVTNTYGRFEDKDTIIAQGKARSKGRRITKSSNYKRRMTQLYNQIAAGREYDAAVVEDVRQYCEEKNDQEKMRKLADPSYEPKLYDISVLTLRGA